jgi:hypothetical protein
MHTALMVITVTALPFVVVLALVWLSTAMQRAREEAVARQVEVTDAIHRELGAVVSPVVKKRLWGPWQLAIAVPLGRPETVGTVLGIASMTLASTARVEPRDLEIIVTPQEAGARDTGWARREVA